MANPLAGIPFLGGWQAQSEVNQQQGLDQFKQAAGLVQLQAAVQEQARKQQAAALQQKYRDALTALGPNATEEQILGVSRQFASPGDLMKSITSSRDRQAQTAATREAARSRLQQLAQNAADSYALRWKTATRQEEKDALEQQYRQFRMRLDAAHLQQTGERLFYDTGIRSPQVSAPTAAPSGQPAERPTMDMSFPPGTPESTIVGTLQQVAASGQPVRAYGDAQAPSAQPVSTPAPSATTAPTMPTFTGSPRQIAEAQNRWRAAQGKLDVNLAGGRESTFINRVVMSGNQAAADLANVVQLPMTASRGLFGGRSQGKSLFEAGKETLANVMTTQEVQSYNVMATGFQRALAAIEGAGLAPTNALMDQMDAVIFKEGDTNFTKLLKLAQTRQIVEKGLETIVANPRVPAETKKHVEEIVAKITKSVPFTASDLMELQRQQQINPDTTLGDIVGLKSGGGASGGWTDAKERRLQELRAKQRGAN